MHCPFCRHPDSRVVDSRDYDDGAAIRRRRACPECGRRFTTVETASLSVVKRSGATEPFSRTKVISGVRKACEGRPVTEDALALLAQQVEETVRSNGCAEVPAHEVGLAILPPLRDLDEVAYMRFASVYRSFSSLADFEGEIAELRAHQRASCSARDREPCSARDREPCSARDREPCSARDREPCSARQKEHSAAGVQRFGGAHDPAPPPVHATTAVP